MTTDALFTALGAVSKDKNPWKYLNCHQIRRLCVSQTVRGGVIETVRSIDHAVRVPSDCIWIEFDSLSRNE